MKMYRVGGSVRDELLGVKSKDQDYTVVLENLRPDADPFRHMVNELALMGFVIFLESPEFFTVRAKFPKGSYNENMVADFVLARKESHYSDGRRPDKVELGTLEDDLARRDFTMNAIARGLDSKLIDPHNGHMDIQMRIIRAVGDPMERLTEDALRAVRALRFSVTKRFRIEESLAEAMESYPVYRAIIENIADERIQQELSKMFRYDTKASLTALSRFPALRTAMFSGSVSLDATMKQKGRGGNG